LHFEVTVSSLSLSLSLSLCVHLVLDVAIYVLIHFPLCYAVHSDAANAKKRSTCDCYSRIKNGISSCRGGSCMPRRCPCLASAHFALRSSRTRLPSHWCTLYHHESKLTCFSGTCTVSSLHVILARGRGVLERHAVRSALARLQCCSLAHPSRNVCFCCRVRDLVDGAVVYFWQTA
jgi:hypothetical protein